jgi:glutathione synthase/RimK-type ligase-like ATP-grasp enzyme
MNANQIYSLIHKHNILRYIDGILIVCDTEVTVADTANVFIHTMHILVINTSANMHLIQDKFYCVHLLLVYP